ncbi:hypothetical protein [Vibrio phage nt-1]|uniref:Uncharacterized protein n=1 Tax=Vibrio phage nt-1 TaxID=115992 RepID=A0A068JBR4_9CAUD|nr:hypothetical protein VPFG_p06 [Vibrio phage nt-1]AIE13776.1 hypothetical protein [Vibrio phage nt-1]
MFTRLISKFIVCKHLDRIEHSVHGIVFWQCPHCGEDNYRDR